MYRYRNHLKSWRGIKWSEKPIYSEEGSGPGEEQISQRDRDRLKREAEESRGAVRGQHEAEGRLDSRRERARQATPVTATRDGGGGGGRGLWRRGGLGTEVMTERQVSGRRPRREPVRAGNSLERLCCERDDSHMNESSSSNR